MPGKPDLIALGLCCWFVALAVMYSAVTPVFESPDEASHFLYIHNFLETRQLPVLEDRAAVFESQSVQRHHPPLYYAIGAALIAGTTRSDLPAFLVENPLASIGVVADTNQNVYLHPVPPPEGDTVVAVWILRVYSIVLSTATVWLIYRSICWLLGDQKLAVLAVLLVVSIPTFLHISASINNDNLVVLFHTAGVYLCARMWSVRRIRARDMVLMGIILGGVALTKVNGLTLFPIVYGWVILGAIRRRYAWRQAAYLIGISVFLAVVLAGWWYVRNIQLYGDPLALDATLRIWGRGGAPHLVSLFEAKGIWESFWFILGYFNIRGPGWLYDVYLPLVTIAALVGLIIAWWRERALRLPVFLLTAVTGAAVVSLLVATSRVNVSQGRLLFPAMVAFAPLYVIGWTKLLGRRVGGVIVAPLAGLTLVTPFLYLANTFVPARIVDALPADARSLNVSADGITMLGYTLYDDPVKADGLVALDLYLRGENLANPYLYVKALEPSDADTLGGVDNYPGMMPTRMMYPDAIYAIPVRFHLDPTKIDQHPGPYRIRLAIGWRIPDDGEAEVPLTQADGASLRSLIVDGPTFVNRQRAPASTYPVDVVYGDLIHLSGFTLSSNHLSPGKSLTVTLAWNYVQPIDEDWMVGVGLLDADGYSIAVADGAPAGYPTSAWRPGPVFADPHVLRIPDDAQPGSYELYVGWYRLSDGVRLSAVGDNIRDNLFMSSAPVIVCADPSC